MGDLTGVGLSPLMKELHRKQLTGILTLKKGKVKKSVFYSDGAPIFAASNLKKDRIGEMLVSRGVLSQDQLNEALSAIKTSGKRMGAVMVERKWLSPEQLRDSVKDQVVSIIYSVFRWTEGEYHFRKDDLTGEDVLKIKLNPGLIIYDGFKIESNHEKFAEKGISPNSILGDHPKATFKISDFSEESTDKPFLELIDGEKSIREIASMTKYSQDTAESVAYALISIKSARIIGEKDHSAGLGAAPDPFSTDAGLSEDEAVTTSYSFDATDVKGAVKSKDGQAIEFEEVDEDSGPSTDSGFNTETSFKTDPPGDSTVELFGGDQTATATSHDDLFSGGGGEAAAPAAAGGDDLFGGGEETPGLDQGGLDELFGAESEAPKPVTPPPAEPEVQSVPLEQEIANRMAAMAGQTMFSRLDLQPLADKAEVVESYNDIAARIKPALTAPDREMAIQARELNGYLLDAYQVLASDAAAESYRAHIKASGEEAGHKQFCEAHAANIYTAGRAQYRDGKFAEALTNFERAVRLDATNSDYMTALALACVTQIPGKNVDIQRAQNLFRQAMEVNPYEPRNYFYMGVLLRLQGYNDHAKSYLQRALQLNAEYPQALQEMAMLG